MKRIIPILLLAAFILPLAACSVPAPAVDKDGWKVPLENALGLIREYDPALLETIVPPSENEYFINYYKEKGEDYEELLRGEYAAVAEEYNEVFGEDWVITYELLDAAEKDEEGIRKYKEFDGFYFETYGIDTDKIQAVTFVKALVKISGSKGENSKEKTVQCFCYDGEWYSFYALRFGLKLANMNDKQAAD
ncbi:MAG: hypothetical protein J6P98_02605 [Clostridia bacterium]|nr:hypothetical protein [Clostridia bacterium]